MTNHLDRIVANRRQEIELLKQKIPLSELETDTSTRPTGVFRSALESADTPHIIAELKKGSPSRGVLRSDFNPVTLARDYQQGGAAALSVLTEETHFFGRPEYMEMASRETDLPILCKDFIVDPYQLHYARYMKADAVLLIASLHSELTLANLIVTARNIGLDALVEVREETELTKAVDAGAEIIGVNNRNLNDFSIALETSEALAEKIPDNVIKVAESGIFNRDDIVRLGRSGYTCFLIGEALVTATDRIELLRSLRGV